MEVYKFALVLLLVAVPLCAQPGLEQKQALEILERNTKREFVKNPKYSKAVHRYLTLKALEQQTARMYSDYERRKSLGLINDSEEVGAPTIQRFNVDTWDQLITPQSNALKKAMCNTLNKPGKGGKDDVHKLAVMYGEWAKTYVQEDENFWHEKFHSLDAKARRDVKKLADEMPDEIEVERLDYVNLAAEAPDLFRLQIERRCR